MDPIEVATFRSAMARLASAVTVVTTDGPAGRRGMAATAVTSVTDDPPNLLVCVNKSTRTNAMIKQNGVSAVNVLSFEQEHMVGDFSGGDKDPFGPAELWEQLRTGAPILRETLASLDCTLGQIISVGTHGLFVGHVTAISTGTATSGLVYFDRNFVKVDAPR